MDESEKKQLEIDKARFEKLKSTMMTDGWKEIESIVLEIYHESLTKLIDNCEDKKSGGAVWAMKEFMSRIDTTKKMLEHANDLYIDSANPNKKTQD